MRSAGWQGAAKAGAKSVRTPIARIVPAACSSTSASHVRRRHAVSLYDAVPLWQAGVVVLAVQPPPCAQLGQWI